MSALSDFPLADEIHDLARPLSDPRTYDDLLAWIGDARLVLLGEGSRGTHELYAERAELTRRLVEEKGFHAVAVVADALDSHQLNRFLRGMSGDPDADAALSVFGRFPAWTWQNQDVLAFVRSLRAHDDALPRGAPRVGLYGLDLYGLHASIDEALRHVEAVDSGAARLARERYRCFDDFELAGDVAAQGDLAAEGVLVSCEDAVVRRLLERLERAGRLLSRGGGDADEAFLAEEGARVAKRAETYYRTMYRGGVEAWNLHDRHLAETLEQLLRHLDQRVGRGKVVVWGPTSHLGDARFTALGERSELSFGQLVRERHGDDAFLVGFTTYAGTVTAASTWGGPAARVRVRAALPSSYEALFHRADVASFALDLRDLGAASAGLRERRLERAIGVLYSPATERSHYFEATLPDQLDAVIHLDETRAVEPSGLWSLEVGASPAHGPPAPSSPT
jgi:erythromycin esterase-like protein